MKKFMKAIAFVTVMCMALSTVAFAAGNAVLDEETEKVLNITVTGAGTDQVALMVVASDATDFSNPLYLDQKAADGSADGKAEFTAVLTNADVDAVDVYVGYATYAATNPSAPEKVGEDVKLTKAVTTVTVSKIAADIIQGNEYKAQEQTGAGVWAEIGVTAPAGVEASQMIWAIRYTDAEGAKVKYSDAINVSEYHIGNIVSGSVKLGLAFLNGSDLNEINPVEITGVDAIFLFEGTVGEESFSQEVLTNADDAANKDPNNN